MSKCITEQRKNDLWKGWNSMVNVTDVRVRRINQEGRMKSIVSVTLDDAFVVHDVKVVEGQNGLFVAMPSRKMPDGDYRDIAHPINSEARAIIQKHVLEAYDRALAELEEEEARAEEAARAHEDESDPDDLEEVDDDEDNDDDKASDPDPQASF